MPWVFAAGVLWDAVRRDFSGSEPLGMAMMIMALVAAAGNIAAPKVLKRLRGKDVNLRAATTFSFSDFLSDTGIFVRCGLVM